MKEHPILFSAPMIKAILAGRKTQTRRIARFVPLVDGTSLSFTGLSPGQYCTGVPSSGAVLYSRGAGGVWNQRTRPLRYYALVGDRLWVKETWHPCDSGPVLYAADYDSKERAGVDRWRPSLFMSRADSRITLEVTGVRCERLEDITEEDAKAEGVEPVFGGARSIHRQAFVELWDRINGKMAAWKSNPFVWVVSFKRLDQWIAPVNNDTLNKMLTGELPVGSRP